MEQDVDVCEQLVDLATADVDAVKFDAFGHLVENAVRQIVDADHAMAFGDEPVGQVASDEPGDARHRDGLT